MKYEEIAALSEKELKARLKDEKVQLTRLAFNHAVANLDQPSKIRHSRRAIARMMTEINKRKNTPNV